MADEVEEKSSCQQMFWPISFVCAVAAFFYAPTTDIWFRADETRLDQLKTYTITTVWITEWKSSRSFWKSRFNVKNSVVKKTTYENYTANLFLVAFSFSSCPLFSFNEKKCWIRIMH